MGAQDSAFLLHIFLLYLCINLQQSSLVTGDANLIEQTCRTTKYYDLCASTLNTNPASRRSDVKGLATIMINAGIANATATYSYLSLRLVSRSGSSSDEPTRKVLKLCADKYSYANNSLRSSLQDLDVENYDYASIHVSAAADYPNACRNAFKRSRGLVYPNEISTRENDFKRICAVALGIIDVLVNAGYMNLLNFCCLCGVFVLRMGTGVHNAFASDFNRA